MNTTLRAALAATAAALVLAPAASAGEFRYFDCPNAVKLQNVGMVVNDFSWSATKPTGSFMAGEGCGYLDTVLGGTGPETIYDGVFGGNYGGAFKALNVEVHDLVLTQSTSAVLGGEVPFNVRLTVDGDEVLTADGRDITAAPIPSATGASQSFKFSITGLDYPALADGGERRIVLTLGQSFLDTAAAWVMDASEVPSNVMFIEDPLVEKPVKPVIKK